MKATRATVGEAKRDSDSEMEYGDGVGVGMEIEAKVCQNLRDKGSADWRVQVSLLSKP